LAKPVSRILVINDEPLVLREIVKGLNAAARSLENPCGITFSGVTTAREALGAIESDGDIQSVLVDDKLYSLPARARRNGPNSGSRRNARLQMSALELVQRITRFRPELDVYILIAQEKEDDVVDALFTEAVDGYFYREERDYRGIYRILNAQIQERARTPFTDQLKSYVWMAKDQWHTPGHSSGESLRGSPWVNDFYEFMGEHVFDADLSVSVPMLDSLMDPKGVILEAQALAAKAFGARRTFFATNGTSTANKVIFQTLLAPGEKLLLDRNCHKSVHHGVVLSGAHPIYLDSALNRKYGLYGPVPKRTLLEAINAHPDAQALILTSCTYDGLRYDLAPIVEAAHEQGTKVIVDEAWYGFARFHPAFRPTALESGADYATQSTHKVLSAFSQASMIHINDPDFKEHLFRENFNMHTSTSPQYGLIASLDVARKQAVMEGYKLLSRTLELAAELRKQINATGVFRCLELEDLLPPETRDDGIRLDPTKVTVDISGLRLHGGGTAARAARALQHPGREEHVQHAVAAADGRHDALQGLADVRRADAHRARGPHAAPAGAHARDPGFTKLRYLPRDAYFCGGELVPVFDEKERVNRHLAHKVCADGIVPYPPGSRCSSRGRSSPPKSPNISLRCCARRSGWNCTASSMTATRRACGC
jgi:arginine decarboxylase